MNILSNKMVYLNYPVSDKSNMFLIKKEREIS